MLSEETTSRQLVVFRVAGEEYAAPIGQVHEIIRFTAPRTIASPNPALRGVISLRGRIVPVHDLAQSLGLHSTEEDDAPSNIVIVEIGSEMAGLIVGEVEEVITIDSSQLDEAGGLGGHAIDAIAKIDDRLVVLLDCGLLIGAGNSETEYYDDAEAAA